MTIRSFGAALGGYGKRKSKGDYDAPTDKVRSHSYDVNDPRAKPGRQIGDGSARHQWVFTRALRKTAEEHRLEQQQTGYDGPFKIQPSYLLVLDVLLSKFLFGKNGDFFASSAAVADLAGVSVSTVKHAELAFEYHGYFNHVRRSEAIPDADGSAGPQRKQASNARYFDCAERMAKPLWKRLWKHLWAGLKSLDKVAARAAHLIKQSFNSSARPAPREPDTELMIKLARMADGIDRRDGVTDAQDSAAAILKRRFGSREGPN